MRPGGMCMPVVQRRKSVARVVAGGTAVLAHVYVVAVLVTHRAPTGSGRWDDTDLFVMIDLPPADLPAPQRSFDPVVLEPGAAIWIEPPAIEPSSNEPAVNDIGPSIDWLAAGEHAAAGAATGQGPAPRDLGSLTHAEPEHRAAKPFAWDRSQTEQVTAVPGGIRLRMGSHCQVVFAPWPVGGCSLGEIPARGDLFSEMSAPAAPGDLRDDSRTLNGR